MDEQMSLKSCFSDFNECEQQSAYLTCFLYQLSQCSYTYTRL